MHTHDYERVRMARMRHVPTVPFDVEAARCHIARVISACRVAKGLTQTEVAQRIGRSPSVISALENLDASTGRWTETPILLQVAAIVDAPPALVFPTPADSLRQRCLALVGRSSDDMLLAVCRLLEVHLQGRASETGRACAPAAPT